MTYRVHNMMKVIDGKQTNTGFIVAKGKTVVYEFANTLSGFNQAVIYAQTLNMADPASKRNTAASTIARDIHHSRQ
jgi:hypothetical protein